MAFNELVRWGSRAVEYFFPRQEHFNSSLQDNSCPQFLEFKQRHFSILGITSNTKLFSVNLDIDFISKELADARIYSRMRKGEIGYIHYSTIKIEQKHSKTSKKIAETAHALFLKLEQAVWVSCPYCSEQHPIDFNQLNGKFYLVTKQSGDLPLLLCLT